MLPSISSHVYSFERSPFIHQLDQLSALTNQITFATPLFIVAAAVRPSLIPIICPPICISIESIFFHRRIEFLINSLSPANGAITYHIMALLAYRLSQMVPIHSLRGTPQELELCLAPPQFFFLFSSPCDWLSPQDLPHKITESRGYLRWPALPIHLSRAPGFQSST